jgi:hypothetical protein
MSETYLHQRSSRQSRSSKRFWHYKQPSLFNRLLFRLSLLHPLKPMEFPMSTRRNLIIRTVTTIVGDFTTGVAIASLAVWVIETAALGLFLSFMVWLITALLALALSQYVVHPAITVVMSDRKLDVAVKTVSGLADRLTQFARTVM